MTDRRAPVPDVVTLHNTPGGFGLGDPHGLFRSALENATWVTAVSRDCLLEARRLVPAITPTSSVIENGTELTQTTAGPAEPGHFSVVARLIEQKRIEVAIEALALVRAKGHDATLTIAGDGPRRQHLQKLSDQLGTDTSVRFAGALARADMVELLNRTSAVVMPSRMEGLPMAALEAAALGVPVIASSAGGLGDFVTDRVTGRALPRADPPEVAAAMAELVSNPARGRTWGAAARRRVQECHDVNRCVAGYLELYRRLSSPR